MLDNHNPFEESKSTLDALGPDNKPLDERIGSPSVLRNIHESFKDNDEGGAANRAATQELVDFVPPYDPEELEARGQGDRFNVNFGLVSAIKNEAVSAYHDIYTTPTALLEIALKTEVNAEEKQQWASIMSEEFTAMLRSWDAATPQMLLLADLIVTHGVGIPWFEDSNNIQFEVSGMEDFNFDDDQVAISSKCEAVTAERIMNVAKIWSKVDGKETDGDGYTTDGWNRDAIVDLINDAQPGDDAKDSWDLEKLQREMKGNRVRGLSTLKSIRLVWGFIRELDGTYSVYAAGNSNKGKSDQHNYLNNEKEEKWVYRERHHYKDANEAFQIFPFGIGNKNNIHTIRGLAYFLYEAGQADNVMKCKALDAARMRASDVYQPQGGIEAQEDMQMVDIGHAIIIPPSLKGVQASAGQPLDRTIGVAQDITREVMDRHSGGLASQGSMQSQGGRKNELEVAAELDHMSKLLSFAVNLYYPPFEKLLRELARRAFTESQTDLETIELVKDMKKRIVDRGVPKEVFRKIDIKGSKVSRIMGAGSRGTRMLIFSQMSELYPEMDAEGKENFTFDWSTELVGNDKTIRYFGRPQEERGHIDMSIARLENGRLQEGDFIEVSPGQNHMVHLEVHIEEGLEPGLAAVEEGTLSLEEYVTNQVTLFQHVEETMQIITVHKSDIPKLNSYRQRVQQVGEVIQNGLRAIAADNRNNGGQEEGVAQEGDQAIENEAAAAEQKLRQSADEQNLKLRAKVAESLARIEEMRKSSEAERAIKQTEHMQDMAIKDAETAAALNRARILESAKR